MNFKQFGRTANLFDKTNITQFYYNTNLATSSRWDYSGTGIVIRIPCDVNTTYTISCDIDTTVWRISTVATDNTPASGISVPSFDVVRSKPANGVYTFTTQNNAKYILFQVGASVFDDGLEVLMVNLGSTALPYQPYKDWTDIPHYIHNTSTDTITTLPAVIHPTGTTATVGLKGNTLQSSIPSPTSPVMPQGTGERTGNLWSFYPEQTIGGVTLSWNGEKISYSGTCTSSNNFTMNIKLKAGTYTLKANANRNPIDNSYSCIDIYRNSPLFMAVITNREAVESSKTFTIDEDMDAILRIRVHVGVNYDGFEIRPMLNLGLTALPYEPWGIKIPISSANTITPVYLGEVETTRKIEKVVLKGTESWVTYGGNYFSSIIDSNSRQHYPCFCTHLESTYSSGIYVDSGGSRLKVFSESVVDVAKTVKEWKTYLQQQYTAGTPVTVWYVLSSATTGTVNEPLRKIGNYADEVSGISIPTIAGANTISVDTTLQPSAVSVNYKGWHPVTDVHERESGAWT